MKQLKNLFRRLDKLPTVVIFCLPALVGFAVFWFYPMYKAIDLGFHRYNLISARKLWNGLGNYQNAINDSLLWLSVRNTVLYFLLEVPPQMALAFCLALLVKRGPAWLRTIILLPTVTSVVVVSVIWGLMYHPNSGLINSFLQVAGLPTQPFLTSQKQALPSIALLMIWKNVGFSMLFYLAGLMAIPGVYYESAMTDGAGSIQRLWYITIPLLRRTTVFLLLTNTISAFKVFTPVYIITGGGPVNATRLVVLYIFENAFRFNKMGYASALSILLALFLLAVSVYSLRISSSRRKS